MVISCFSAGRYRYQRFSLAKLITWLLVDQPILVWSFFFGLVLASTWFVSKDIKEWKSWKTWVAFVIGAVVAFYITVATPAETPSNLLFIFLCGAIAICAMILPGISGSFILVLLGKYFFIMDAVKTLDVVVIAVFGSRCLHWNYSSHASCRMRWHISATSRWRY